MIDELHINENAHSRILNMLLQYSHNGQYVILRSFVEMIKIINPTINISVQSPECTCEQERIDVLIKENGKYAIIIENKVNYAVDQDKQIQRYVDKVIETGVNPKGIFVFYLTRESDKEVSDYSLPDETKKILDYEKENSRFIPLNYRDHILPWLENDVLPNCALKEELLISALKQYIDFLKGLLNLRKEQIKIQEKMDSFTIGNLEIKNIKDAIAINNDVKQLSESVDCIFIEMRDNVVKEYIIEPLKTYCSKWPELKVTLESHNCYCYFVRIKPENWSNCSIAFAFDKGNNGYVDYGITYYDASIQIEEGAKIEIMKRLPEKGYDQTDAWACWKRLDPQFSPNETDYWLKVQSGEINICEKMIECINEIYPKTEGIDL